MSLIRNIIEKRRNTEDLGLDRGVQTGRQRMMNADGTYNIEKRNHEFLGNFHLYHWLLSCSWAQFWLAAFVFYGFINGFFATLYYTIGIEHLNGIVHEDFINDYLQCFFFSIQTSTTVGYGSMHPTGLVMNFAASIEAFVGLMSFALATGTLYGRFSRATTKIKFSKNILVAPYKGYTALQFMIANQRVSNVMELEATVNYVWMENKDGELVRSFKQLPLEINRIALFPVSWTIVHPIDEESPLYGKTKDELIQSEMEVFIMLKGFDETFSQTVYCRSSYTSKELVFGAKFNSPFQVGENGKLIMDTHKVGEYYLVDLEPGLFKEV